MRVVRFLRNAAPYNAGEEAGIPDALAIAHVRNGVAVYSEPDKYHDAPQVGERVDLASKRERHAATDARGVPLGGEAPGSMPDASDRTTEEGVTGTVDRGNAQASQQPARDTHVAGKGDKGKK